MKVHIFENGVFKVNTYLLQDNNSCIVIDPGENLTDLYEYIQKHSLSVHAILLTHGHIDHVFGTAKLQEKTGAKTYLHKSDIPMTEQLDYQSRLLLLPQTKPFTVDIIIKDNDTFKINNFDIKVIYISGHTAGSVCFLCEDILFSGDTLFNYTVGRTDLLGSTSHSELIQNIRDKLFNTLDEKVRVYPGHGPSSTIGFEKVNNIMFK